MARQECDYYDNNIVQVISTSYSITSSGGTANINDGTYFSNKVCQKAGWYRIDATASGSGASGQPCYLDINVEGKSNRGIGWSGSFNGLTFASNLVYKNVGDSISISSSWSGHTKSDVSVKIVKVG